MSNLNVKKVLVEAPTENFTAGKEYEVFKEAGYTYIVDEVNVRLYFDLENKTFGYFNEGNVDLFSFGRGKLTIVPVIEKVKQVGDASYLETGAEYAVEYDGLVPFILDEVGDRMYFDLEAQTYGYFRTENVGSWSFCEYDGVFLEEVEQTDLEEAVMTGANEVKIEEGLKFKVVQDLVLEGAEYREGEIYTVGEGLDWADGANYAVVGKNGESFVNLDSRLKEAFEAGYFEVLEEAVMTGANEVKIVAGLKFEVVEQVELEGADYSVGEVYEVLRFQEMPDGLNAVVEKWGWDRYVNLPEVLEYAFKEGKFKVIEEVAEVQADKVPRCITLKDIEEGKIKVGDRVASEEGSTYEVLMVDVQDTGLPLRLSGHGWWGFCDGALFRVEVEVTYLDFQEDREPLATYGAEEVEIVEEDGKLVVYSKENK